MRFLLFSIILVIVFSNSAANGQVTSDNAPEVLAKLYHRLVISSSDADRIRINDSIRLIFSSYAESDTVFNHRFRNLRYAGQITSPDSLIKIITWNLNLENSPSMYYCYLIRKQAPGKKNIVYRLTTTYKNEKIETGKYYSTSDWYGALYYDIRPVKPCNDQSWVLLGMDLSNSFISKKIIDVLSFTSEDSVIFGKKWFVSGENVKYRDVFEYSSAGMMSLRFSSDSSIVFDHLVPFSPEMENDRQYYGPDYSYDSYDYEKGTWKFKLNVDARNKE